MNSQRLSFEEAKNISIVEVLAKLQHFPTRKNSKEAWYLSPLRTETRASFKVSLKINCWYDFGTGKGGGVIDLIRHLKGCEALEALNYLSGNSGELPIRSYHKTKKDPPKNIVLKVQRIRNKVLRKYLFSRGISLCVAHQYTKEVSYQCNEKQFSAIGLGNHLGGWELRSPYFKTSSSPKSYSLIQSGGNHLLITEGLFDLLSLAEGFPQEIRQKDIIVLNSLSFLERVCPIFKNYEKVELYLDNDQAGKRNTRSLLKKYSHARDKSGLYDGYKDLNEKLVSQGRESKSRIRSTS